MVTINISMVIVNVLCPGHHPCYMDHVSLLPPFVWLINLIRESAHAVDNPVYPTITCDVCQEKIT